MKSKLGLAPMGAFVLFFFYLPVSLFIWSGVNNHLNNVIQNGLFWNVLAKTISYCLVCSIITALISTPIALKLSFLTNPQKNISYIFSLLPLVLNPIIIIFGWQFVLGSYPVITICHYLGLEGILYTPTAVLIGMIYLSTPVMIFSIINSLKAISVNNIYVAKIMGATDSQIYWRVIFPLSKTGYLSGMAFVFVVSCGYFVVPSLLGGGKTTFISTIIEQLIDDSLDWNTAAQLSLLLILSVLTLIIIFRLLYKIVQK